MFWAEQCIVPWKAMTLKVTLGSLLKTSANIAQEMLCPHVGMQSCLQRLGNTDSENGVKVICLWHWKSLPIFSLMSFF